MPDLLEPTAPAPAPAEPVTPAPVVPAEPAPVAPVIPPVAPVVPAPVVPESYDLKIPKDYYNPSVVERVAAEAKELKLSPAQAQKMLDSSVAEAKQFEASMAEGMKVARIKWAEVVKTDKEIGGQNLTKSQELSKAVLNKFASKELIKDFERSGFGDHPEMLRLLYRIGQSMKEDDFILPGSQGSGSNKDIASSLYDHPTSQPPKKE